MTGTRKRADAVLASIPDPPPNPPLAEYWRPSYTGLTPWCRHYQKDAPDA